MLKAKQIYQMLILFVFITIYGLSTIYANDRTVENTKTEVSLSVDSTRQADVQMAKGSKVIYEITAYYFHGTQRCATCLSIEKQSKAALDTVYSDKTSAMKIQFVAINTQEKENQHFVNDYHLDGSSLILTVRKNQKEVKWKNLQDVWLFTNDSSKFYDYVKSETMQFLKETE